MVTGIGRVDGGHYARAFRSGGRVPRPGRRYRNLRRNTGRAIGLSIGVHHRFKNLTRTHRCRNLTRNTGCARSLTRTYRFGLSWQGLIRHTPTVASPGAHLHGYGRSASRTGPGEPSSTHPHAVSEAPSGLSGLSGTSAECPPRTRDNSSCATSSTSLASSTPSLCRARNPSESITRQNGQPVTT